MPSPSGTIKKAPEKDPRRTDPVLPHWVQIRLITRAGRIPGTCQSAAAATCWSGLSCVTSLPSGSEIELATA